MKKLTILLLFLTNAILVQSQKNIDGLAKAERSFAAHAVAHGIKAAFLRFADSTAVMFDKGKAVNAIQLWNSRDNRPGILNWFPDYIEISASHDFGYTTGPWTFQRSATRDSIEGNGRFITIWHWNNVDEWTFLLDLGVNNTPFANDTILHKMEITDPTNDKGSITDLKNTENNFIQATKQSIKKGHLQFLSAQTILNINGAAPARTPDEIDSLLNKLPPLIEFTIDGLGISSSGDLGYVYGVTLINGKTDNYLHVWRKETNGWKLALEVLHP
jgi:hypothetical protein